MTPSLHQIAQFQLASARNTRCHIMCFGAQEDQSFTIESKKINVAGQGQPKHLNIQPYHALKNAAGINNLKSLFCYEEYFELWLS